MPDQYQLMTAKFIGKILQLYVNIANLDSTWTQPQAHALDA